MSLSQGCTAEYRTVLQWSTEDASAEPAIHTVRSAVLQNAPPPPIINTRLIHLLMSTSLSVCQSVSLSGQFGGSRLKKEVQK